MWPSEDSLKLEFHQILYLQNILQPYESILEVISQFLAPHIIFQYIAPLICALTGQSVGDSLATLAFAEYLHLLFKWILRENRPFWWIRETKVYTDLNRPNLRQNQFTCETTAGSPSAHATLITVLLCTNGRKIIKYLEKRTNWNRHFIKFCVYSVIIVAIVSMWFTRMYFGCHFLHQCVAGTMLGLFVIKLMNKERYEEREILNVSKKISFGIAILLMIMAGALYLSMIKIDDPLWSVRMAFKWCESVTYLAHETTPVYGIIKNLGAILGLAASATSIKLTDKKGEKKETQIKSIGNKNSWKQVLVTVLFLSVNFAIILNTPKTHGRGLFLFYIFTASAFHTYSLIRIVPKVCDYI